MTLQKDIADFLVKVFGGARDLARRAYITSFPDDPATDVVARRPIMWAGGPAEDYLPRVRADHNIYMCVSTFLPGADGRVHRRRANFEAMHFCMIDDVGYGPSAKIPFAKVKVNIHQWPVETSPGNFQLWTRFAQPIRDAALGERLVDRLIDDGLLADDPGMRGVTRYGRLPFGVNTKTKYKTADHPNGFPITSGA